MSEENKNQITYDDDWKSATQPEYPQIADYSDDIPESADNQKSKIQKKKKDLPKQLLITIQLIICIIIALAALVLRNIGGDVYETVREWYYSQLNSPVIFDDNSNDFGLDKLFGSASKDEV